MHFCHRIPMKRTALRIFSLVLAMVLVFGCCQGVFAASPSSSSNVSATLAYTLRGLPLGRATLSIFFKQDQPPFLNLHELLIA